MNKIETLVGKALARAYRDGYECDGHHAAQAVVDALEAAGLLRDQTMSHEEAVRALR
jgi:hypothetical protein